MEKATLVPVIIEHEEIACMDLRWHDDGSTELFLRLQDGREYKFSLGAQYKAWVHKWYVDFEQGSGLNTFVVDSKLAEAALVRRGRKTGDCDP